MKPYDVDEAMEVIENGGESGTSYTNESLRDSDVEQAYHDMEDAGYTQNARGSWDAPD
nr:hypothetical protein [Bacteroides intestinalis]